MAKIDEQISYNWLFFLLAGAFGAVTFWAVYDETATRREYKGYQETFFGIESNLAKKAWDGAKAKLDADPARQKMVADLKKLKDDLEGPKSAEYKAAQAKLQELEFTAFDKAQDYTFTKSNLDEEYYKFTKAKHELPSDAKKDSKEYREFEEHAKKLHEFEEQLGKDEAVMIAAAGDRDCQKKGTSSEPAKGAKPCSVIDAEQYKRGGFTSGGRPVAVDAFTAEIARLEKELEDAERPVKDLERKYLAAREKESSGPAGLFGPATEVKQQNLEELGRVDRCESCHVGSNRGGFEGIDPKYFRSHPYRRTLFAIHPVEKFGCTTCHDGQGRATQLFHAHAPTDNHHDAEKHFWEFPLLKGPFMESECRQCHRQEVELRSVLRCESDLECPANAPKCAPLAAPLNPAANVMAQLEAKVEDGKYCGQKNGGDESKIDPVLVELAPHLARGRKVIEEVACYGCHPIEGYESRPKAGPDLRHAASKLSTGWMVDWIQNPKAFRPNTRMPNFFPEQLHLEEYPEAAKPKYRDGMAELDRIQDTDPEKVHRALDLLSPERFQPVQQASLMASFLISNSTPFALADEKSIPAGDAKRGEQLVDTLGCYGCHNLTKPGEKPIAHPNRGSHYDNGPDLGNVGAKTSRAWIYGWVKDPKAYAPQTRMPNLRLSDQEAADIATFLAGNKYVAGQPKDFPPPNPRMFDPQNPKFQYVGKRLISYYGCYGCHYVKGLETTAGIGAELTEFGTKEVSRLDYGDYIVAHTQQTWEAWIENKLKHPRVYRYERVETRMPQFDLQPDEIQAAMVVLKGMRGKTRDDEFRGHKLSAVEQQRERGRELVRYYNCYGCHTVDGHTGDIRALSLYNDEGAATGPRFAPPVLIAEGAKTQPPWLFSFLKAPVKLRPHLQVRMPTFGMPDADATQIVAMFSAFDGADFPYHDYTGYKLDGARKDQALSAFKAAQCQGCHTLGDAPSADMALKGAPNLLLAKNRLRGDWLARWLRDPSVLYPGVNMPSFFPGGNVNPLAGTDKNPQFAAYPGIAELSKMGGDDVIYLLRDFLMTLEPAGGTAQAAPARPPAGRPAPLRPAPPRRRKAEAPGTRHATR